MEFITAIQWSEYLKKAAGLFAGLGHLQPLLLVTTNSHYLLDRFCMERCCSGDYISRTVTSLIFMEILAIIVVRIVLYRALGNDPNWISAKELNESTRPEDKNRRFVSISILWAIFLGYIQILCAFTTGGKKGHMHWFYVSLLIQHFLNSLIAGSIGFWEVGLALWYLVTLPMAPIIIFFYQLYIHSWIRSHGPSDIEYLVVKNQIWLAISISCIATIFWSIGYVIPYISTKQSPNPYKSAELTLASGNPGTNIKIWSTKPEQAGNEKSVTISATENSRDPVPVTIRSITVATNADSPNDRIILRPNRVVTLKPTGTAHSGDPVKAKVEASKNGTTVTLTLTITKKTNGDGVTAGTPETLATRTLKSGATVNITSLHLALDNNPSITVQEGDAQPAPDAQSEVKGWSCSPYPTYYYFSGITGQSAWNTEWDGGKCYYVEYYNSTGSNTHALLKLCILGNILTTKYYGTTDGTWKKIDSEAKFSEYLDLLKRTGEFTNTNLGSEGNDADPSDNFKFSMVFGPWHTPSATWLPLLMQGLSVGAVGSIFPNLIPKTLTCPKTTRTLTVINMFIVPLPHIFNVMLGDMDLLGSL